MAQDSVITTRSGFSGRTALVSGGGSGIGRAVAVAVAVDIAPWVVALAEPTSWVTGQVIGVDGGYLHA